LYEKSPKKCRELEDIVADLCPCVEFDDSGVRPLRASGLRWVSHKLRKCNEAYSFQVGLYTNYLLHCQWIVLSRLCIVLCFRDTVSCKISARVCLFVDLLSPYAIFSKVMQEDDLDVLGAFSSLIRTGKEVNTLSSKPLEQWRTYCTTLTKLSEDIIFFIQ